MAETPDGFVVAVPAEIVLPDPKADPVGYARVREAVKRSMANDIEIAFVNDLRDRNPPRVNQAALAQLAHSEDDAR